MPQVILTNVSANLFAQAQDSGDGGPPAETDSDTDFDDFFGDITAEDISHSEPGRDAMGTVFQDSRVRGTVDPLSEERFDTEVSAEAVTHDTGDDRVPEASAHSSFSATFEVTGGPAAYRMAGDMGATASASNTLCSQATTSLNPGHVFRFFANAGACGSSTHGTTSFDRTGMLAPGAYSFVIQADAGSKARNGRDARAKVTFNIALTFGSCTIVAQAGVVTIGTTDDDIICGTESGDDIRGSGGEDTIYGFEGVDSIEGEEGRDTIFSGPDGDIAVGGDGNDFFIGEDGADSFSGGPGADFASGGPGGDQLTMGGGRDFALGDAGDDIIEGGGGGDFFDGDEGDDCLIGGAGRDTYLGGGGNDTLVARDGLRDTGSGGPGPDRGRFDEVDHIGSIANRNFQGRC